MLVNEKDMGYTSLHRLSEWGRKEVTNSEGFILQPRTIVSTDLNENDDRKQISHRFFLCRMLKLSVNLDAREFNRLYGQ